jgi:hypothetical protein
MFKTEEKMADFGGERGIHTAFYANDLLGFNSLPEYWYPQKIPTKRMYDCIAGGCR